MTILYQSKFSSNGSDGFGMLSDVILQYCADGLEESEVNALIHELKSRCRYGLYGKSLRGEKRMNKFIKWLYGKKIEIEMNKSADKINVEKIRTWIKEVESEADTQEERDKMEAMTRRLMEDIENRVLER